MAAFSVADGVVYGQCHPRKRFVDFRSFLETVLVAEAQRRRVKTVALVLDNGPMHACQVPKQGERRDTPHRKLYFNKPERNLFHM